MNAIRDGGKSSSGKRCVAVTWRRTFAQPLLVRLKIRHAYISVERLANGC